MSNDPKLPSKMHGVSNAGHAPAHAQAPRHSTSATGPSEPGTGSPKRRTPPLPKTKGTKTVH